MNTNDLIKLLPDRYEDTCYKKKAITRKWTIRNPLDLLKLTLFYFSRNKSLINISQFALINSIRKISDIEFMKKFIKFKDWIIWLTQHILPNPIIQYKKSKWLKPYQITTIDASNIVEKKCYEKTMVSILRSEYISLNLPPVQNNGALH